MPILSKQSIANVTDAGVVTDRAEELGGHTLNWVDVHQTHDMTPLLKGLPGDLCQCPHWGYLFSGRMTVRYADRTEVVEAGSAFYLAPGHCPAPEEGTEMLLFSPTDELAATDEAIARNLPALAGA